MTRLAPPRLHSFVLAALVVVAGLPLATAARADGLRVALVTHGACLGGPDDVLPRVQSLLSEQGHQASIVRDAGLANELDAFDVVVLGAGPFLCEWDWSLDPSLADYVNRGGGLVATGWVAYYLADNPRGEVYPGLESVLPVAPGTDYHTEPRIWAISGHPITEGVTSFSADYDSTGGGVREGATPLLRVADTFIGAAWNRGNGRVVFLGPNFLGSWTYYSNRSLLDGSQPEAERLLVQAVEWAGRQH